MHWFSPQWMLLAGILLSFPLARFNVSERAQQWATPLLQFSVVCLGATLNFHQVIAHGAQGALDTGISLLLIFAAAWALNRWLQLEPKLALLLAAGTAICGGSAIAALAPVILADAFTLTMSMAVVFCLNSVAVFSFPWLGHFLGLSETQFGLWSALAIHDTSSVVAATSVYGARALELATTIKLTRALWIVPLALLVGYWQGRERKQKLKLPWFILGFAAASLIFTFVAGLDAYRGEFLTVAKAGFSLTLLLVGLSFSWEKLKALGARPFIFAVSLWALVIIGSLSYVHVLK